jgi:hypothetical protein
LYSGCIIAAQPPVVTEPNAIININAAHKITQDI